MSIERLLKSGLTVADLKAELDNFDDAAVVVFACDYGDHCHTQQALPIQRISSLVDDGEYLEESAYSQSNVCVRGHRDDEDNDREPQNVVVLR